MKAAKNTTVRANEIKVGQIFKKSEALCGTSTYKCVEKLIDIKDINGKCTMTVELIKTTSTNTTLNQNVGKIITIAFYKNRRGQYPNIKVKTGLGNDVFGNDIETVLGITKIK